MPGSVRTRASYVFTCSPCDVWKRDARLSGSCGTLSPQIPRNKLSDGNNPSEQKEAFLYP